MKELQKVQNYFSGALKILIHITNTSSDSPLIKCETASISVLHSSPAIDTDTDTSKKSPLPRKHGLSTLSAECSQEKRVKSVTIDDSVSSIDSSAESSLPKKGVLDATAIEKENHVVGATVNDYESTVTIKGVWVQLCRNTLMMEDKFIIEGGLRLTDKHINFASCLISRQFPHIGGLRTTLLQSRYYCFPSQSIQAIFCKRREHWIVASNMGTSECSIVCVYDSLFSELDKESSDLILRIFHNRNNDGKSVTIIMKNMQKQNGSVDCGLFAIAVMTSLAYKEDPSTVTYDQKKMRQHLQECFFTKLITSFPKL